MADAATLIEVWKCDTPRYDSVLHRRDGVRVALEGGSYNRIAGSPGRLPHDIAHFVVEERYGLRRGLWGVLASGGIVQNATFAAGRRPPHALRRAKELTDAAGEDLRQAEVLVRATADLTFSSAPPTVADLDAVSGERWRSASITTDVVRRACADLQRRALEWDRLRPGQCLALDWVDARTPSGNRSR